MSATTTQARPGTSAAAPPTFARVLAAEWGKLLSLRSTWWTLAAAAALQLGLAALMGAWARSGTADPGASAGVDATGLPIGGLMFVELTVVVLGALTITAEYASGQIRPTLAAVPRRTPVLWAKTVCVAVAVAALAVLSGSASLGVGKLVGGDRIGFHLSGAQSARILLGGPLYLLIVAVLAVGVGTLLRNTAATVATLVGLLLVVPVALQAIHLRVLQQIVPWLPSMAGQQLLLSDAEIARQHAGNPVGAVLDPWAGYGVLVAWAVVALVAGAVALRRRDV